MHDSSFAPCSVGPSSWLHSKAKGQMAECDAWPDPKGARQHDRSGQGQDWLGPDHSSGWSSGGWWPALPAADLEAQAVMWIRELNHAGWNCGMHKHACITMEMFNSMLRQVVQSLAHVPYMMPFRGWPCVPSETWVAGCLSPLWAKQPGPLPPHQEDNGMGHPNSVDWAYHLAALLRLLPPERRTQYMCRNNLVSHEDDTVVFMSGLPNMLSLAAFQILLGSLDPPVPVTRVKHGAPLGTGCYMVEVGGSNLTPLLARKSVVQLVMTFHQRLVHWPGPRPRHTLCIPLVVRPYSSFRVQHQPTILVELALAAWDISVERWLLNPGPSSLTCGLGLLDPSLVQTAEQRKACADRLTTALQGTWPDYLISDWAHGFHPSKVRTRQPKQQPTRKGTAPMASSQLLAPVVERHMEEEAAAAAAREEGFGADEDVLQAPVVERGMEQEAAAAAPQEQGFGADEDVPWAPVVADRVMEQKAETAAAQRYGFGVDEDAPLAPVVERDVEQKPAAASQQDGEVHERMFAATPQVQAAVAELSCTAGGARPDPLEMAQILSAMLECELEAKDEQKAWLGSGPEQHTAGWNAAAIAGIQHIIGAGSARAEADGRGIASLLEGATTEVLQLLNTILVTDE